MVAVLFVDPYGGLFTSSIPAALWHLKISVQSEKVLKLAVCCSTMEKAVEINFGAKSTGRARAHPAIRKDAGRTNLNMGAGRDNISLTKTSKYLKISV